MADDDSSDLSSLSSLSEPPSDDESDIQLERQHGILKFFHKVDKTKSPPVAEPKDTTPPRPKREASPPHEFVLADNADIAFIVMFRSRFTEAFPKSLANFGPQELERDVVETIPGERVEHFLCALLSLLLNRKQDVKPGHYNRALEEALQTHKTQWPKSWEAKSPVSGAATFATMTPVERLSLLRTLIHWTLSSSDVVKTMINANYKNRHDDDLNITLSVQPWGSDGDKRRYYLIEGNDDTAFRVYRESNPAGVQRTWWSVAGSIDELKALGEKLETTDGGPKARTLAKRITNSIPRFEATEEKRRRRDYRQMRKEQFKRPESGFSLYEGRTRGKRMKYTYSDEDEEFSYSDSTNRRSTRNTRNHTPAEPVNAGPVTTASGRQVRAPMRLNVEAASNGAVSAPTSVQGDAAAARLSEDVEMTVDEPIASRSSRGRPRRTAALNHGTNGWSGSNKKKRKSEEYESDEDEDDEDEGSEPEFGDDEEDEHVPDEDEDEEDEFLEDEAVVDDDEIEAVKAAAAAAEAEALLFKFPVRVAFDENGKAKPIPGPPPPSSEKRSTRPRTAHRNVIVSDESAESTDVTGDDDVLAAAAPEKEEETADVISVAFNKPKTAATTQAVAAGPTFSSSSTPAAAAAPAGDSTPIKSPLTPSSVPPSASLAFMGSPEKLAPASPQQQVVARPIDVGGGE
ncbi:hypothetical protein B0T17DRAFT_591290 [Bombardia bombarda]|uniref:WHIM1 domain-containing protein n=1 Tax=Bombardia bombarda TaxID=252184 RepID=A0AA40C1D1_9PEZI|nr:hypothetical protein B0T17DRAFT_591290 [Bombardia bombarda]